MFKFVPQSLFARFILIIIIPTILSQGIITYIFFERHWNNVTRGMIQSLVGEVVTVVKGRELSTPIIYQNIVEENLPIEARFIKNKKLDQESLTEIVKPLIPLYKALTSEINYPVWVEFIEDKSQILIQIQLNNGLLSIVASKKRIDNFTTHIFIYWMTGVSTLFFLLSIIFSRNQIRPIIRLARAADKLGKGQPIGKIKLEGAQEVRKAYQAFFKMRARIEHQISQRTEMLAGVSHDLRTPLTRMKLHISMSDDKELKELNNDILDMEKMINSYLNFAKAGGTENSELVNYKRYFNKIMVKKPNITFESIPKIKVYLKPNAFKRALINIVENSLKYGKNVKIDFLVTNDKLITIIEDDGPGIPNSEKENVFKPFYRIDKSRNSETGGVGLGLAIARNIIAEMGGTIVLKDGINLKGLRVEIALYL